MSSSTQVAEAGFRVVHVIDSGGFFGAEQVIVTLASEQLRGNVDVVIATIIAPQDNGNPLGSAATRLGIPVREFVMTDGLNLSGLRGLLQWIEEQRFAVVHCHGYKANILMGIGAPRRREWALIATLHGWTSTRSMSKLRAYEVLERALLRRFDAVCPVSAKMRARLSRRLRGSESCVTVANGIDLSVREAPLPEDIAKFAGGRRIVLGVGRLSPEKNYALLIEAVAHVINEGTDCCVVLVGYGPERDALRMKATQLGLENSLMLCGYRQQPREWMGHCSVFVLSSTTEGLPMVLLEALAAGLPVVSTSVGAIPEVVVESDTQLVPPGQVIPMGQAIGVALRDLSGEDRGRPRREIVRKRFSAAVMARAYSTVYAQALAGVGA